jgi:hypothetical protein
MVLDLDQAESKMFTCQDPDLGPGQVFFQTKNCKTLNIYGFIHIIAMRFLQNLEDLEP